MKLQPRILAGTAIGLLMASAPLGASPLSGGPAEQSFSATQAPLILVQDQPEEEQIPRRERRQREQTEEGQQEAPAENRRERRQREQSQEQQQEAPAENRRERRQREQAEQPQEQEAPAENRRERRQREQTEQEQQQQQAPAEQPAEAAPAEEAPTESRRERRQREQREQAEQEQQQQQQQAPAEQPAEAAPAEEAPAETRRERRQREQERQQQQEQAPAEQQPAEAAPSEEAPAETRRERRQREQREQAEREQQAPAGEQQPAQTTQPENPNEAPLFDSAKEAPPAEEGRRPRGERQQREGRQDGQQGGRQRGEQAEQAQPPVDPGPPPESDAAATRAAQPRQIEAVTQERGQRRDRRPEDEDRRRRDRPEGVDVLREIGDRVIIELGNQVIVESNDRPRMTRGARDVYYEDLPRGRTRETIVRDNGVEIVTIRDRYGDVIRRSRITPDGREYVLVYVDEDNYDRVGEWRDPGLDLPPMRVNIPRNEYILESEYVEGPDDYYEFLEQPPVENVQRLYSVDEVKRSARVRDIARRVDLDTLTFEFGSASIADSEIERLDGVAQAMERLLDKNPAETFLIEGHTDAVGSDVANLALSDRRAEAVADALTNVFGIPPENLATQGYGEQYLKVRTQSPERENRRVAIRRITPLVAPVASAN